MADSIYIVSTYYHALIACVKLLAKPDAGADICVTAYIPGYEELADRIEAAGIFRKVFRVGEIREYKPKNKLDIIFNLHRKNAALTEKQIPFSFYDYDEIYIFHDDIWAAHYCKDRRIDYNIIEDSLDCFKNIGTTPFSYMADKGPRYRLKSLFRIGYVFYGYEKHIRTIEVNEAAGITLPEKTRAEIAEVPREKLFGEMGENEKRVLSGIFMKDIPDSDYSKSTLLLTQPLYADGILGSEKEQERQYKRLVAEYAEKDALVIKPHPRDGLDYSAIFPEALILPKDMPMEILSVCSQTRFGKTVTFFSTSAETVKTREKITGKFFDTDK